MSQWDWCGQPGTGPLFILQFLLLMVGAVASTNIDTLAIIINKKLNLRVKSNCKEFFVVM